MNNYHIYSEIGRGKGSTVYKGREKKTINYVAIKSVEKQFKQKVLNEVRRGRVAAAAAAEAANNRKGKETMCGLTTRHHHTSNVKRRYSCRCLFVTSLPLCLVVQVSILYSLSHPNILKFLNWYETSKHIWLILEYCSGGNLLTMLRLDQAMPERSCRKFAFDILCGLQYLHSNGYIYVDLKPSNILVNEYGTLMLCDFGLAKRVKTEEEESAEQKEAENSKRGSPYCQTKNSISEQMQLFLVLILFYFSH